MVKIVEGQETYRLISDGDGRYAVVEVRCGHVYSLDSHHSRAAEDNEEGMLAVVGKDGWYPEREARRCFEKAIRDGRYFSRVIW